MYSTFQTKNNVSPTSDGGAANCVDFQIPVLHVLFLKYCFIVASPVVSLNVMGNVDIVLNDFDRLIKLHWGKVNISIERANGKKHDEYIARRSEYS